MDNKIIIRTASAADAPALLKIYRPYVENTAITFEYDVPSTEEFASLYGRIFIKAVSIIIRGLQYIQTHS